MDKTINVKVENKIAVQTNDVAYVCNNSDFVITFDFDSEWNEFTDKIARFAYDGNYTDVLFTGNQCSVPILSDVQCFLLGVYAGDLHTTAPVYIRAIKSILCETGVPAPETPDVYGQMMELFTDGMERIEEVNQKADATEQAKLDAQVAQKAAEDAEKDAEQAKLDAEELLNATTKEKESAEEARVGAEQAKLGAEAALQTAENGFVSYLEQDKTDEEKAQARKNIDAVKTWDDLVDKPFTEEYVEDIVVPLNDYYFNQSSTVNGVTTYLFTDDTGKYYRKLEIGAPCNVLWQGEMYECICKRWGEHYYIGNRSLTVVVGEDTGEPFYIAFIESLNRLAIGTNSLSGFGTCTVKAYIPKVLIAPIPTKFITRLTSPNGNVFELTVNNDGTLGTVPITN